MEDLVEDLQKELNAAREELKKQQGQQAAAAGDLAEKQRALQTAQEQLKKQGDFQKVTANNLSAKQKVLQAEQETFLAAQAAFNDQRIAAANDLRENQRALQGEQERLTFAAQEYEVWNWVARVAMALGVSGLLYWLYWVRRHSLMKPKSILSAPSEVITPSSVLANISDDQGKRDSEITADQQLGGLSERSATSVATDRPDNNLRISTDHQEEDVLPPPLPIAPEVQHEMSRSEERAEVGAYEATAESDSEGVEAVVDQISIETDRIVDWLKVCTTPILIAFNASVVFVALGGTLSPILGTIGFVAVPVAFVSALASHLMGTHFDVTRDRLSYPYFAWRLGLRLSGIDDANAQTVNKRGVDVLASLGEKNPKYKTVHHYNVNLSGDFRARRLMFRSKFKRDQFLSILRAARPDVRITRWS
ncbi:hypothetical protein AC630_28835 [Bradyrhizobium sp. AS23.2]|nr:hypothetical protein AC630_28835 [Bradyrhizobium sp. AS23.2]